MKIAKRALPLTVVLVLVGGMLSAQPGSETRETLALTYPEGPTLSIKMRGTERLPRANGEAKVERKKGITEIEIELDEMKPARYFGGDYNTYVMWVVSPEGLTANLGEFILQGNRSKLNVSTSFATFGMFVSAEPHFLVRTPSRFVVIENSRPTRDVGLVTTSRIKYRGYEGTYNSWRETLADIPEIREKLRPHVGEARTAVELARRAEAETYAPEEFQKALASLQEAEGAVERNVGQGNLMLLGHRTVRMAVEAEQLGTERAYDAALQAERNANAQRIDDLQEAISEAETQAERARLETQRRQLQLEMEQRARRQAAENAQLAAQRAAEAEARAQRAREEAARAQRQAELAERSLSDARNEIEQTQQELTEAQKRMRQALSTVVEIRETTRGLILNLPDILFDFGKSTLKPPAREIVSRMAGILLVSPDYGLRIEGHTDSVGSEEYNQKLSLKRAQAVRDYLEEAGLGSRILAVEGFGESKPVASNDTAKDRQKNRRVEIVIQEQSAPVDPEMQ